MVSARFMTTLTPLKGLDMIWSLLAGGGINTEHRAHG